MSEKCECELIDLLEAAKGNRFSVSRWDDTHGFVWCDSHRVWMPFTVPEGTWPHHWPPVDPPTLKVP